MKATYADIRRANDSLPLLDQAEIVEGEEGKREVLKPGLKLSGATLLKIARVSAGLAKLAAEFEVVRKGLITAHGVNDETPQDDPRMQAFREEIEAVLNTEVEVNTHGLVLADLPLENDDAGCSMHLIANCLWILDGE